MIVLDVEGAAVFLKISPKTARSLIVRLPHGDVSRSSGQNAKLVIAQETLERFVSGRLNRNPSAAKASPWISRRSGKSVTNTNRRRTARSPSGRIRDNRRRIP